MKGRHIFVTEVMQNAGAMRPLLSIQKSALRLLLSFTACAAASYFLVMLAIPEPQTRAYSLDAIASVLGSGTATEELDVQLADPPAPSQDQRDQAVALALADRLSVEPGAVRVVLGQPHSFIEARNSH